MSVIIFSSEGAEGDAPAEPSEIPGVFAPASEADDSSGDETDGVAGVVSAGVNAPSSMASSSVAESVPSDTGISLPILF